jgi:hypothetical protein
MTSHRITRRAGLLMAVAAIAVPAAQADGSSAIVQSPDSVDRNAAVSSTPIVNTPIVQSPDSVDRNATVSAGQLIDKVSPDARDAADTRPVVAVQPVVEVTASDGMDWGDAAIGAGVALGLVLLAAGGTLTVRRHHGHGDAHTA